MFIGYREGRRLSGNSSRFRIKNILSNVLCFTLNISDLGFTKFTIIVLISAGRGRDRVRIKILNPSLPRPWTGRVKVGWGKIAISKFLQHQIVLDLINCNINKDPIILNNIIYKYKYNYIHRSPYYMFSKKKKPILFLLD